MLKFNGHEVQRSNLFLVVMLLQFFKNFGPSYYVSILLFFVINLFDFIYYLEVFWNEIFILYRFSPSFNLVD